MARLKRSNRKKRSKGRLNIHFNLQVPTVSWLLICFSIAGFYVANGRLWLVILAWLLLISAAIYFNTYWYGDANKLKNNFNAYVPDTNYRVLIMNTSNSDTIDAELHHLESQAQVTVMATGFNSLIFNNGEFDLVLVNYAFQEIRPRLTRIKAMQEAARVVKTNGNICIVDKGFNADQYAKFLRQSGFTHIQTKNNGFLGWWSGPWRPSFTIVGKKW
ncbi:class I SAM-dependent methyltransferase [Lactobacillaceae bacterium Melli_B4]